MKKTEISIIVFFIISISSVWAQSTTEDVAGAKFLKAEKFLQEENFQEALPIYHELESNDSTNANLNYKMGLCYLNSRKGKEKACNYLEKAAISTTLDYQNNFAERDAPLETYKLLGDAYHLHSNFDKAIETYENFKKILSETNVKEKEMLIKEADRKIEICNTAKELVSSPVNLKIVNLGKNINSSFGDYSPVVSADQSVMIFTSRRPESIGGNIFEGKYFEDIYISTKTDSDWTKAVNIGEPINTFGNEASVGITIDGQQILIYKDDKGDGNLYSTNLIGDQWTKPVKLNSNINSKAWEPSAFIAADGNTIYFTSNRKGGFGGRDIYKSTRVRGGDWGEAVNLGPTINTPYEEDAPFIHPDGRTLYFSSNGHKTMGGFDIFSSTMSDSGKWAEPVNIGYPINSPDDDVFYVVSPDKKTAYYTSFKEDGLGEKDNYMINLLDQKEAPLTLLKGIVLDLDKKVPDVDITVTDNETGEIAGIYHTNSKTGKYTFILTPGKNYNIAYEAEGYLFYSENRDIRKNTNYYEIFKAVELPPIFVGSRTVLNNIFFESDKADLHAISNIELKRLFALLSKYPKMKIEISGYADAVGTEEYNLKLSQARAQAVVDYLVSKGIKKERLVAKGYGELDKNDNSGNKLNRRAELKIISIK